MPSSFFVRSSDSRASRRACGAASIRTLSPNFRLTSTLGKYDKIRGTHAACRHHSYARCSDRVLAGDRGRRTDARRARVHQSVGQTPGSTMDGADAGRAAGSARHLDQRTLTPFERNPRQAHAAFISKTPPARNRRARRGRRAGGADPGWRAAPSAANNFWMDPGRPFQDASELTRRRSARRPRAGPEAERLRDVEIAGSDDHPEHANGHRVTRGVPGGFFRLATTTRIRSQTPGYV